jgi:ABC-type multidrug transport system fused ATPase/permease subunit
MQRVRDVLTSFVNGERVLWPAAVTGVTVAVISVLVGTHRGDLQVDVALVSMAAFLFGVLLAFTIVRMRERLASVQELVAKGNSGLFSIHELAAVFHPGARDDIRALVDVHLTDQIDYRLVDYHLATTSYQALLAAVRDLNPVSAQQQAVFRELIVMSVELDSYRALIEATTGQEMSSLEWTSLLLLLLVLLGLISVLPGGTILGAIVVGTLAVALATLMILLRKLDMLRWHERVTIWEPTSRLFRSMDRDPYVPRIVIEKGRYLPVGRVRVVDYPDPYPDRSRKVITLEEHDGSGQVVRTIVA